jgi:hypothetical protein
MADNMLTTLCDTLPKQFLLPTAKMLTADDKRERRGPRNTNTPINQPQSKCSGLKKNPERFRLTSPSKPIP